MSQYLDPGFLDPIRVRIQGFLTDFVEEWGANNRLDFCCGDPDQD